MSLNYPSGGGGSNSYYQNWCNNCQKYYWGAHACGGLTYNPPMTYTYWPTQQFQQLEAKPKYEEHTLDCGCKVKTVVVEHCDTLHKAPEE